MDIAPLFGISLATSSLLPSILVYWRTPPVESYMVNTDGCVKDGFESGGGLLGIHQIETDSLWSFTTSLEVEDLGLLRPLFATSDISLPSTVILFLIFIVRATRWLTYLLQRVGSVVFISSTVHRTYRGATTT
ncbi:hypothetical protein Adt_27254 [Abeliophyllum distichum]|uniref:Uncharacterized protein n=1 Tax=Abeliophyllum distichum TaxID=126358 RepID=A0ABD1RTY8_9LAMI